MDPHPFHGFDIPSVGEFIACPIAEPSETETDCRRIGAAYVLRDLLDGDNPGPFEDAFVDVGRALLRTLDRLPFTTFLYEILKIAGESEDADVRAELDRLLMVMKLAKP